MSSTQLNQTEKTAKNIDDAILAALEELGASRDMVDIEIFDDMGIKVDLDIKHEANELSINLIGDDMGIIIGKRGETLDSLQYLTSLVVNRGEGSYVKVTLDTENYREKRFEALKTLALRIADKVTKTGRRHIFEPMNPYERRVLHAALQSHEAVTTYSIGEDPNRKVVVALKNDTRKK